VQGDAGADSPATVKRTGQTYSYHPGDDGDLELGVATPEPRFTILPDDTVRDNLTGLVWSPDAGTPDIGSCGGGPLEWTDALTYVSCLNDEQYLGHDDWRLPNVREFVSLLDFGDLSSPIPSPNPFLGIHGDYYWTSTGALRIDMTDGSYNPFSNGDTYVWPVRGGSGSECGCFLDLSPSFYDFGYAKIEGETASKTFSAKNHGAADVTVSLVEVEEGEAPAFAVTGDGCGGTTLAPGETCSFDVVFTPMVRGAQTAEVRIIFDDPGLPVLKTVLWGHAGTAGVNLPRTGQTEVYAPGDDGDLLEGVSWPEPRFTIKDGACVIDNLTGLVWYRHASSASPMSWEDALTYAQGITTGGCSGWRLPNANEMLSLLPAGVEDPQAWLTAQGFLGVPSPETAASFQWSLEVSQPHWKCKLQSPLLSLLNL
jgi:hypothetical protein